MGQDQSSSSATTLNLLHDHFPRIAFHGVSCSGKSSLRDALAYYNQLRLDGCDKVLEQDPIHYHRIVLGYCLQLLMELFNSEFTEEDLEEFDLEKFSYEYFAKVNENKVGFCYAISNPMFLKQFVEEHETIESFIETADFVKIIWDKQLRSLFKRSTNFEFESIEKYFEKLTSLMRMKEIPPEYHLLIQSSNSTDSSLEIVRNSVECKLDNDEGVEQPPEKPLDQGFKMVEIGADDFDQRFAVDTSNFKSNYFFVSLSGFDSIGETSTTEELKLDQSLKLYSHLIKECPEMIVIFTKADLLLKNFEKRELPPSVMEIISKSGLEIRQGEEYSQQVLKCIIQGFEKEHNEISSQQFRYHILNQTNQEEIQSFCKLFWDYEENNNFTQFISTSVH